MRWKTVQKSVKAALKGRNCAVRTDKVCRYVDLGCTREDVVGEAAVSLLPGYSPLRCKAQGS